MKIVYFAWLREQIGTNREEISLPKDIATVADLVEHLRGVSAGHGRALGDMEVVRVAVNHEYAELSTALNANDEVAFFPPVTGG